MKDYLIIPDPHAHPSYPNDRADWLGKFILDRKPDVVINMGDTWDLPSLCSYDKGKGSFYANSYQKDIESGIEFNDRLWHPLYKSRKKKPRRVFLVGNHEQRIKKVLEYEPHLSGDKFGISPKNLQLADYYQEVVQYEGGTPGIFHSDDIAFAHYFSSGLLGRALSSKHHADALVAHNLCSSVAAHSHTVDWSVRTNASGKKVMGLVAGVYQDYRSTWAGSSNDLWWRGVVVLKNVSSGTFTPEFISIEELRREYGN